MLSSITPLGERGRNRRWGPTVAAYTAASAAAGGALGGALGALGGLLAARLPLPATVMVIAVLAAIGVALDGGLAGLRLPTVRRQVDETWLTEFRGWVVGLGYGAQLGVGVVTIVTTATVYLVWALALLTASAGAGALVGVTFGLVRALPLLGVGEVTDPARLASAHRRLDRWRPRAHRTAVGLQAGLAVLGLGLVVAGAMG